MKKYFFCLLLCTALLTGCSGNLQCFFVSANMSSIMVKPTDARSVKFEASQCYWWVDKDNHTNVAGQGIAKSILGPNFDREFYISFVLDTPSKGVGKNYQLTPTSVRGLIKIANNLYRFTSTYGILGSENYKKDQLRCAFRANSNLNGAQLFGGWSSNLPFLIYGNLVAVPDQNEKGKSIREKTEKEGTKRTVFPITK